MSKGRHKQLGYAFEREVGEGLSKLPGFYFKIPDSRTMQFKTQKVPADYIYAGEQNVIFVEAKSSSLKSFPIRNIKEHQLSMGVDISKNTIAKYVFVIYMRAHKQVFIITPIDIIKWIKDNPTRSSIKLVDLEKTAKEVLRFTARYNNGKCAFIDFKNILK